MLNDWISEMLGPKLGIWICRHGDSGRKVLIEWRPVSITMDCVANGKILWNVRFYLPVIEEESSVVFAG